MDLEQLRHKINAIDANIVKKLAQRQKIVKKIGQLKLAAGKDVFDAAREKQLMDYYEQLSGEYNLPQNFVKQLFKVIIAYSRKIQKL